MSNDPSLDNMAYEGFMRGAFGFASGKSVERGGDPAGLAEADVYASSSLEEVKAGAAYAMAIIFRKMDNEEYFPFKEKPDEAEEDYRAMEKILRDVINATSKPEVLELIKRHKAYRIKHKLYANPDEKAYYEKK